MLFPETSTEDWCKKHHFTVQKSKCPGCKLKISTTRPFIEKDWIGLIAPICDGCGYDGGYSVQRARDPNKFKTLTSLGREFYD